MRIGALLLVVWLVIGAVAAAQRDYFSGSSVNCAKAGTIAVTVLAGPLNYLGVNPKVKCTAATISVTSSPLGPRPLRPQGLVSEASFTTGGRTSVVKLASETRPWGLRGRGPSGDEVTEMVAAACT